MSRVVKDTKRDKIKQKLSSQQMDVIQIDLTREELALKRQAIETMKESTKSTEAAIKAMSSSIADIGQNIKDGLAMLASTIVQCQQLSQIQSPVILHPNNVAQNFSTTRNLVLHSRQPLTFQIITSPIS